jgi:precorrin-2 dehydrogenase/sirohydrochlorin ferrochelatase
MSLPVVLLPSLGPALVVGGGTIAARKCATLIEAGFEVTVVAPGICEAIRSSSATTLEAPFGDSMLDGYRLVLACTDDRALNQRIGLLCRERGTPVVVADRAGESTVHMPAVARERNVTLAVSTGGRSPAAAKRIRDKLRAALREILTREAVHR